MWSMWWKSGSAYLGTPFVFPPRFAISDVQAQVKYWDIVNEMTQQLLLPICFGKNKSSMLDSPCFVHHRRVLGLL